MVRKVTLLLIAGLVWLAAGVNILRIGVMSCFAARMGAVQWLLMLAVFAAFGAMFMRIVKKHTRRILGYAEEKRPFWNFFNTSSYLLMAGMMSMGILLRRFAGLPPVFFAVFYTGLGAALSLAGVLFLLRWVQERR